MIPPEPTYRRTGLYMVAALALLGLCIALMSYRAERILAQDRAQGTYHETEILADTAGYVSQQLASHGFESGNASDTATRLVRIGRGGGQSLALSPRAPFSPGLWIPFKDLRPPASAWIRATGYVWFSDPEKVKCSFVITCNHKGTNYKYMFVALEEQFLQPRQWNRVSLDYRIPEPPDPEDVLQAYFWYRGDGILLVDDIEVRLYTPLLGEKTKK